MLNLPFNKTSFVVTSIFASNANTWRTGKGGKAVSSPFLSVKNQTGHQTQYASNLNFHFRQNQCVLHKPTKVHPPTSVFMSPENDIQITFCISFSSSEQKFKLTHKKFWDLIGHCRFFLLQAWVARTRSYLPMLLDSQTSKPKSTTLSRPPLLNSM